MKSKLLKVTFSSICFFSIMLIFLTITLYSQEAKIRIIKKDAVVRLKPSDESLIIKKLPLGSELDVEETMGEWIKIKLPPDKDGFVITGYIHTSFVEFKIGKPEPVQKKRPIITETPKIIDSGLSSWQKEMDKAKARIRTGNTLGLVGFTMAIGGLALYYLDKEEIWEYDILGTPHLEEKHQIWYLISASGGFALTIAGMVIKESAKNEIRALELEGARRNYILASISPIKGGFAFKLSYSF